MIALKNLGSAEAVVKEKAKKPTTNRIKERGRVMVE